jgi:hypothetical protein
MLFLQGISVGILISSFVVAWIFVMLMTRNNQGAIVAFVIKIALVMMSVIVLWYSAWAYL